MDLCFIWSKMWMVNTNNEGSEIIFKSYQKEVIKILAEKKTHLGSGYLHKECNKRGIKISRASIIFFLKDMHKNNYLDLTERSGKGGYAKLYKIPIPLEQLLNQIKMDIYKKINLALEDFKK